MSGETCECHGVALLWLPDARLSEGGRYSCRVKRNAARRRWRAGQKAKGLCVQCDQPADSETLCAEHATAHNNLMGKGKQAMDHQLANIAYRRRQREARYGEV